MKKSGSFLSSISTKLMLLIIIGVFLLSAVLVTVSIVLTGRILTKGAATQMNLFCEERGADLDTDLLRIEDAVGSLARWTRSKIPDVRTITEDAGLRDAIRKRHAKGTVGVVVYFNGLPAGTPARKLRDRESAALAEVLAEGLTPMFEESGIPFAWIVPNSARLFPVLK